MQLLSAPEPFSPAFGEVLYSVSLGENEIGQEISIFNSGISEKIGLKKANYAPVFTLDVTDYLRSQVRIEPLVRQQCGIVEMYQRVFNSCIAYQDWASIVQHTAGIVAVGVNVPLHDSHARSLAADEQDELCWIAGEGVVHARIVFYRQQGNPLVVKMGERTVERRQMLGLVLNGEHLCELLQVFSCQWDDFFRFTVEVHDSHDLLFSVNYRMRGHSCGKVRMAWWNRYGGIDFYTFETLRVHRQTVEKTGMTNPDGFLPLGCIGRESMTVATACRNREHDKWLGQMMGAPQVWVEQNAAFVPVRVTDNNLPVYDEEKTEIEMSFELAAAVPFQSF